MGDKGFVEQLKTGNIAGAADVANKSRGMTGFLAGLALGYREGGIWGAVKTGVLGAIIGQLSNIVLSRNTVSGWLGQDTGKAVAPKVDAKAETPKKIEQPAKATTPKEKTNNVEEVGEGQASTNDDFGKKIDDLVGLDAKKDKIKEAFEVVNTEGAQSVTDHNGPPPKVIADEPTPEQKEIV